MRALVTACLLVCAAAACTPEPPPARDGGLAFLPAQRTDAFVAGVAIPLPDGGAAVLYRSQPPPEADAGAVPPATGAIPMVAAEALLADGSAQPLARDGVTTVEPSARFRVEVGARLPDARLALLDAQDAMVPSDGTVEATATTRFTLAPAAPLRPGSSYTLRLEGAEGRLLGVEDGGTYEPVSLSLRTPGAAPAPARKAKRRRGR
ncbi:MAG TPA: hypothetical protein VIV59_13790 [Anaeromyxobacteraceae bacterium]